jgi:hypothetical protein
VVHAGKWLFCVALRPGEGSRISNPGKPANSVKILQSIKFFILFLLFFRCAYFCPRRHSRSWSNCSAKTEEPPDKKRKMEEKSTPPSPDEDADDKNKKMERLEEEVKTDTNFIR